MQQRPQVLRALHRIEQQDGVDGLYEYRGYRQRKLDHLLDGPLISGEELEDQPN